MTAQTFSNTAARGAAWIALLCLEPAAIARDSSNAEPPPITVQVYNTANLPVSTLSSAEREATWIFKKAGIPVTWVDCPPVERDRGPDQVCKQTADPLLFVLSIVHDAPQALLEESAMGFSLPFTSGANHAAAVFPKIAARADACSIAGGHLLGHVIAHELAHLLFRSNRHTDGLMRANWTEKDLRSIEQSPIFFSPRQVQDLQKALEARQGLIDDSH